MDKQRLLTRTESRENWTIRYAVEGGKSLIEEGDSKHGIDP